MRENFVVISVLQKTIFLVIFLVLAAQCDIILFLLVNAYSKGFGGTLAGFGWHEIIIYLNLSELYHLGISYCTVLSRWRILYVWSFQSAKDVRPLLPSLLPASISAAAVDTATEGCLYCKLNLRYRSWDPYNWLSEFSDGHLVFIPILLCGVAGN
jgi:hypothetical protein